MTTFDYRLIKITYVQRIEYEDGPGSLRNVVSDDYHEIVNTWEDQGEEYRAWIIENNGWLRPDEDDGGRTTYSYKLVCRPSGSTEEWKYAGHVTSPEPDPRDRY